MGYKSDAGSISNEGEETRKSLDRERKYAQRHRFDWCILAPNREGKRAKKRQEKEQIWRLVCRAH